MSSKKKAAAKKTVSAKPEKEAEINTTEILETKISDLSDRLFRTRTKCEALTDENKKFKLMQANTAVDKQDIIDFLLTEMRRVEKKNTELEDKARFMEQNQEQIVKNIQSEMVGKIEQNEQDAQSWEKKALQYKVELDQLVEFRGKKEAMQQEIQGLQLKYEDREKTYKDGIYAMERKYLQDKSLLRKEMLLKVNEAVASFRKVAEQQMADTTKRTIRENLAISAQLQKMSAKTIELIEENNELKFIGSKIKRENALLGESEQRILKRNQANQKLIKLLTEKLKESDQMVELADEAFECELLQEIDARESEKNQMERTLVEQMQELQNINMRVETDKEVLNAKLNDTRKLLSDVAECLLHLTRSSSKTMTQAPLTPRSMHKTEELPQNIPSIVLPGQDAILPNDMEDWNSSDFENQEKVIRYLLSTLNGSETILRANTAPQEVHPINQTVPHHRGSIADVLPSYLPTKDSLKALVVPPVRSRISSADDTNRSEETNELEQIYKTREGQEAKEGDSGEEGTMIPPFPSTGTIVSDNVRAIEQMFLSSRVRKRSGRSSSGYQRVTVIPCVRAESELRTVTAGREESESKFRVRGLQSAGLGGALRVLRKSVGIQTESVLGESNTQLLLSQVRSDVRPWGSTISSSVSAPLADFDDSQARRIPLHVIKKRPNRTYIADSSLNEDLRRTLPENAVGGHATAQPITRSTLLSY